MVILASDTTGRIFHLYDGNARDLGEVRRPTSAYLFGRGGKTVYLSRKVPAVKPEIAQARRGKQEG